MSFKEYISMMIIIIFLMFAFLWGYKWRLEIHKFEHRLIEKMEKENH